MEKQLHEGTTYLLSITLTISLNPLLLSMFIGHISLAKRD